MPIKNNINFLVSDIKNICKKYSLNIPAKMALAMFVEYLMSYDVRDIQYVFTENGILDEKNVWLASLDLGQYFLQLNVKILVSFYDYTATKLSYIKFDISGEKAYIDFVMTPHRPDTNGPYDIRLIPNEGWIKG